MFILLKKTDESQKVRELKELMPLKHTILGEERLNDVNVVLANKNYLLRKRLFRR